MKLYLMQHGKALSKKENAERPLSEQGKAEVGRVAAFLAKLDIQVAEIRHSGKRRAEDSANIVALALNAQAKVKAKDGLSPNDDIRPVANSLQQQTESMMLVGHLPFLNRLSSYLLTGDPDQTIIQFQMGGVICLSYQEEHWSVEWMIVPEMVA
jgi:phosphohistidine phosphatase